MEGVTLPDLPEGFIWELRLDYAADYVLEIYLGSGDRVYPMFEPYLEVRVDNTASAVQDVQNAADKLAEKLIRGSKIIASSIGATHE